MGSVAGVARNLQLTDVPSAIEVTADSLDFDYDGGRLDYRGHVEVDHAGVSIKSDRLTIDFEPGAARPLQKIVASGSVHVRRGDENAYGQLAVYDPKAATITLSKDAKLGSGNNVLTGDTVVVYLTEGRATVHGGAEPEPGAPAPAEATEGGRVRVVIHADASKKAAQELGTATPETPSP